jgi:metal transporter CNNM
LVILAPKIHVILSALLLPFVPLKTRTKIHIFGHDDKEWKAAILEHVNPEELPVAYGGTKTDPDGNPNCITLASSWILYRFSSFHGISFLKCRSTWEE